MTGAVLRLAGAVLLLAAAAACSDTGSTPPAAEDPAQTAPETGLAPSSVPSTISAVERIIAYQDMTYCTPAPSFLTVLGILSPVDTVTGAPVEPIAGLAPQIDGARIGEPVIDSEGTTHTLNVTLEAQWHGLRLAGIAHVWTEASDHSELSLRFADPPGDTVAALNRLGFALAPDGRRIEEADVLSTYLVVTPDGEGSRFTCSAG